MPDPQITLLIRTTIENGADPVASINLSSITELKTLQFGNKLQGGFDTLTVGWNPLRIWPGAVNFPNSTTIRHRYDVTLKYGSFVLFEGRIADIEDGPGGHPISFVADSYLAHLSDDWNRLTTATSLTSGDALETIIGDAAPYITIGVPGTQWINPNVQHSGGLNEFYKMTPGEVLDQVTKEGNAAEQSIFFQLWDNRTIWLRAEPTVHETPDYITTFDYPRITRHTVSRDMKDSVTVEYGDSSSGSLTSEYTNSDFFNDWGFYSKLMITGGNVPAASAANLAQRELSKRSKPTVQMTINATADEYTWLTTARGNVPIPYYQVRSGQTVKVADYDPEVIVAVSVDLIGRTATYEVGSLDPRLLKNVRLADRQQLARQARLISPLTGGRLRT